MNVIKLILNTKKKILLFGKKAKDKWDKEHGKHPRRKKVVEGTLPGMGKEISNKERLKKLSAQFGNLTFKIKPPKKD